MDAKKISVTLSEETFRWISSTAEEQERSVNGQIRFFLEQVRLTNPDTDKEGLADE